MQIEPMLRCSHIGSIVFFGERKAWQLLPLRLLCAVSWCRLSAVVCKLGFILAQHPGGIIASAGCSAGGFFCQRKGLKEGRAVVVSTCAAVASIVTGVLVGLLALGESLPVSTAGRIFLILGWASIVLGIVLLLMSEKIARNLPRSLRRFIRGKRGMAGRSRTSSATIPIVNPQLKSPPKYRP